ncbi:MAG: ABC transporter ATP-binding protein, partial [Flavobacteriales bacterium]|nr:ABC transporter ATP-binding protein [Flavobacteriales bacterium]
MKNTESLLSVQNLSVSFKTDDGWKQVVHGISYDVYRGKTLGLVGESGSGKTVSSLVCMGLLPEKTARVDGGSIVYKGQSLLENHFEGARQQRGCSIAMIFQEPMTSLNPSMRCGEQVEEVIAAHLKLTKQEGKKRVVDLFREVELPEPESIGKRYPHELSGGQKQRVMIAIALAADPDLIIADEPTTALDVTVQRAVIDLLHRLKESRGLGLIFISHDLDVVGAVADDIVVLQHGNIRETGRTIDILTNPQDPYTIKLLSCKPPTSGDRRPLADPENTKPYQFSIGTSPILAVRKLKKTFVTKKSL